MKKKTGILYGVGIGPGDPELLTVKGVRVLQSVERVFAPRANTKEDSLAMAIIKDIVPKEKIATLVFPMTKDQKVLSAYWLNAAKQVYKSLKEGENTAFITIGDPLIYSTYSYLLRNLKRLDPKVTIKTIPGISIVNAAAALFSKAIVEGDEQFAIMPLPPNVGDLKQYLALFDTLVLLKINTGLDKLVKFLEKEELFDSAYFVHRLGLSEEFSAKSIKELKKADKSIGYFSIMIIRSKKADRSGTPPLAGQAVPTFNMRKFNK